MMGQLESEIREVEARIARERSAMALAVDDCVVSARNAVVSPQSLLAVAAVGFVIGSLSKRQAAPAPAGKHGLAPIVGSLAVSLLRAQYGSPWALAQSILQRRRSRAAAATPTL